MPHTTEDIPGVTRHLNPEDMPSPFRDEIAIDYASDGDINDLMGLCSVEPADFENCLACYAYQVACERESEGA